MFLQTTGFFSSPPPFLFHKYSAVNAQYKRFSSHYLLSPSLVSAEPYLISSCSHRPNPFLQPSDPYSRFQPPRPNILFLFEQSGEETLIRRKIVHLSNKNKTYSSLFSKLMHVPNRPHHSSWRR